MEKWTAIESSHLALLEMRMCLSKESENDHW